MPRKRIDSMHYQSIEMINRWLYFYDDLTATECKKMLEDTEVVDLPPFHIPSTPRIHQIIKDLKSIEIKPKNRRYRKAEERKKRKYLLNLLANEKLYSSNMSEEFLSEENEHDIRFKMYIDNE